MLCIISLLITLCGISLSGNIGASTLYADLATPSPKLYADSSSPAQGGALIFGLVGRIRSLDPGVLQEKSSALVTTNICENLVRFDKSSMEIRPALATRWEQSSDRKSYTFYLRKNVKFHDGTSFDAWAVKFNFDRQSDPRHPYHYPSYGRFLFFESLLGSYGQLIEKVEVVDLYTIRITLAQPCSAFLRALALYPFGVVSPAAVRKWKDEFYRHPVGTGPFKFLEWREPHRVVLISHKEYWGKKPYLERVIFEPFEDLLSSQRQLERGQVDFMSDISLSSIDELKKKPDIKIIQVPSLHFCYLAINCDRFPFRHKAFRMGMNHLIERNEIVKNCFVTRAVTAVNPIPPRMEGYSDHKGYAFDLPKALSYFGSLQYPRELSFDLLYPDLPQPYLNNPESLANEICGHLRKGGFQVVPKKVDSGEFMRKVRYKEYDIALWGTIDETGDPDAFMMIPWDSANAHPGGSNVCNYVNQSAHSLLWKARAVNEKGKRSALYRKIQEYVHQDVPIVPLVYTYQVAAHDRKVRDLNPHSTGLYDLSEVWIEK